VHSLVGFVDEQLPVGCVEEEEGVFVAFFHYPAASVFGVHFHFAVFAAHLLFGQQFVVFVVDLEVGVAVGVVDEGVHIVAADGIGDEVHAVFFSDVFAHYDYIGHVVVVPVGVAAGPEAWPAEYADGAGVPEDRVAVDHAVVAGMPEVGGGVDGAAGGYAGVVGVAAGRAGGAGAAGGGVARGDGARGAMVHFSGASGRICGDGAGIGP